MYLSGANLGKAMLSSALLVITQIISGGLAAQGSTPPDKRAVDDGCVAAPLKAGPERDKFFQEWIERYGGQDSKSSRSAPDYSSNEIYAGGEIGDNLIAGCAASALLQWHASWTRNSREGGRHSVINAG